MGGNDNYRRINQQGHGWREYQWVGYPSRPDEPLDVSYNTFKNQIGDVGWKLHISATRKKAQQELLALAQSYGIHDCKWWSEPRELQSLTYEGEANKQHGKTFVVYCAEKNIDKQFIDWEGFIEDADKIVRKYGGAGMPVRGDRKIPGTAGVFYRYDNDGFGNYQGRADVSIMVHDEDVPVASRYKTDPNIPDPFEGMHIGEAKRWTKNQAAMFHAVYTCDLPKAKELVAEDPSLIHFMEPGTGRTMLRTAMQLADYEYQFSESNERYFPEVMSMPLEIYGASKNPPPQSPPVRFGANVLFPTADMQAAEALCKKMNDGQFPHAMVNRINLSGMQGVLVSGDAYEKAYPGKFVELPVLDMSSLLKR